MAESEIHEEMFVKIADPCNPVVFLTQLREDTMREKRQRKSRVTRRTSENRQSRSSSGRSRRSLSATEQTTSITVRKRKGEALKDSTSKKSNSDLSYPDDDHRQAVVSRARVTGNKTVDLYCWICHNLCNEYRCPDCPRAYHNICLKKLKNAECECKTTSLSEMKTSALSPPDLKELLRHALRKVDTCEKKNKKQPGFKKYQVFQHWPDMPENALLYCTVDMMSIIDKICTCFYKNTAEFYHDIKWIYHNCYIIKGPDNEMTQIASKFEKDIKNELMDIEACHECYREKSSVYTQADFFCKVCTPPHQIVWAKLKGFPFWPAKCLRVINGHADVRFFGTHEKSNVPLAQVYKISLKNPSYSPKKPKNSSRMTGYEEAMTELSIYKSNYENKFRTRFPYAGDKVPLDSIKNSGKKAHQTKSKGHQLDVPMDRINDSNEDISLVVNQETPLINVSLLHDDHVENKFGVLRSTSATVDNLSSRLNDNLGENSLEPAQQVVYHMTFSADEENASEINESEELLGTTSETPPELSEIPSHISIASVKGSSELCANIKSAEKVNNAENVEINLNNYFSAKTSENSCAVSSTIAPLITSTHSLRDSSSEFIDQFSIPDSRTCLEDHTPPKILEKPVEQTSVDDDILILAEKQIQKSLVDSITKSKALTQTFCELLLGNKPNIRHLIGMFQNQIMRHVLLMWLELNSPRLGADECKMFHSIYEKLCKNIEALKSQKRSMEQEIGDLKTKLENQLSGEERKNAIKNEIIQAHSRKSAAEINALKKELKELSEELKKSKETIKLLEEATDNLQNANDDLRTKLDESECVLKEKDAVISHKNTIIDNFRKNILPTMLENKKDEECQTDILDAPSKIIHEKQCNDFNLPLDNLNYAQNVSYITTTEESEETITKTTIVHNLSPGMFPANISSHNIMMMQSLNNSMMTPPNPLFLQPHASTSNSSAYSYSDHELESVSNSQKAKPSISVHDESYHHNPLPKPKHSSKNSSSQHSKKRK